MDQQIINIIMAVAGFLAIWMLNVIWGSVKKLQESDQSMAKELHSLHVLVAGDYVKKTDFEKLATEIFHRLVRIDEKLSEKADKE